MKDKIIKILEKNASYYNQMEMAVSGELFTDVADEIVKLLAAPAVSKCVKPVRKPTVCKHKKKYLIASTDGWRCPDCYEILA
jgi:hypothetical protein